MGKSICAGLLRAGAETPPPIVTGHIRLGHCRAPSGSTIDVDSRSLIRDGKRWLPTMGEIHYSRLSPQVWRDELVKVRMGGIDIAASYSFWIHHEETQGAFDWSGCRDLRRFVALCGDVGLLYMARIGPWVHGECRNGGLPDWVAGLDGVRTNDARYLAFVARYYDRIARELDGLLWKDGGPVVGVQIENEYSGPAEHLSTLKRLAIESGLDVPLYTRTGWNQTKTPLTAGALIPIYGGYPDGFWDRSLECMPAGFRANYTFRRERADVEIANDRSAGAGSAEDPNVDLHPYLACEIGAGMASSYHRRIRVTADDIAALALVKIGSGNNLQGYYMYHGGTNPEGRCSSLQESQDTGYWNDMPRKWYDYNAPIGAVGQMRSQYHALRRLHLFLRDFGSELAEQWPSFPGEGAATYDSAALNWSVRMSGRRAHVFVSNYERLAERPNFDGVQFEIEPESGRKVRLPAEPSRIPSGAIFIWPVGMDLDGIELIWASAQPICKLRVDGRSVFVFAQCAGICADFVFASKSVASVSRPVEGLDECDGLRIADCRPGRDAAIELTAADGTNVEIVLLSAADSMSVWKARFGGCERLILTTATLLEQDGNLRLLSDDDEPAKISLYPSPSAVILDDSKVQGCIDGLFRTFQAPAPCGAVRRLDVRRTRAASSARTIRMGAAGVAEAPSDDDFARHSASWSVCLDGNEESFRRSRLRIAYAGDVARVIVSGRLVVDHFYDGGPLEVSFDDLGIGAGDEVRIEVLPMPSDPPIHLPKECAERFRERAFTAQIESVEIVTEWERRVVALGASEQQRGGDRTRQSPPPALSVARTQA